MTSPRSTSGRAFFLVEQIVGDLHDSWTTGARPVAGKQWTEWLTVAAGRQGDPAVVSMCHCEQCQRRTGSPFGVGACFKQDRVQVSGPQLSSSATVRIA